MSKPKGEPSDRFKQWHDRQFEAHSRIHPIHVEETAAMILQKAKSEAIMNAFDKERGQ